MGVADGRLTEAVQHDQFAVVDPSSCVRGFCFVSAGSPIELPPHTIRRGLCGRHHWGWNATIMPMPAASKDNRGPIVPVARVRVRAAALTRLGSR